MARVLLYTTQGKGFVSVEVDRVSIDGAFEINGRVNIDPDAIVEVYPSQVDDYTLHIGITDIYYGFTGVLIITAGIRVDSLQFQHIDTPHELIQSLRSTIMGA